jgi:Asp-tRNA(Asn)/Glu-tRNA(Gln) amidotransferase C subunit
MTSIISIYIPRMSLFIKEDMIKAEFNKFIGEVLRVDFTSIDKKPGFKENFNTTFKSAFIHLTIIYNTTLVKTILNSLNNGLGYKFYPQCNKEYWILLKVKNPIIQTWMNNSQIVENCRYLESKLEIQEETIKYLQEKLEKVIDKVNKLEQKENKLDLEIRDTFLLQRKQDIYKEKRNSQNFSISTSSSMPGLINCYDYNSISSNSSIQDFDDNNNSVNSEKRIKNSIELCGNE